jgi:hypothetical protein
MSCKKYILSNNSNSPQYFNYKKCGGYLAKQVKLGVGQTKNISMVEGSYSSSFKNIQISLQTEPEIIIEPTEELLGRIYSVDTRDLNFLISDRLPITVPRQMTSRYWQSNVWSGDQGRTPMCVGYAWAHWIEDGPITHKGPKPVIPPQLIYSEAQKIDEWPGEGYDGTSVRAGAKYLKNTGKIGSYYWAFDVNTLINTILNVGPVVVGTNWYYGMFFPNRTARISISGPVVGGHAYVINGIDTRTRMFRLKNSWGLRWGIMGHAYISFDDMSRLILERGEICLAKENNF